MQVKIELSADLAQGLARLMQAGYLPSEMPKVVLYTRRGCHLCDDARDVLLRHGLSPRLVDIDADPALVERYNECVPVVEIDGKERFRGQVNEVLLVRLLDRR